MLFLFQCKVYLQMCTEILITPTMDRKLDKELQEACSNKSSLSFGRTSARIVCCFWGMFDTIREPHKIRCVFTFLSQNQKHFEYEKYVQRKLTICKNIIREKIISKRKFHTH